MPNCLSSNLEELQRKLYKDACRELRNIEALTSPTILEYEKSFESSLPTKVIKTSRRALINAVVSSKICLIGDFHTLRQSQREALRILRESLSALPGTQIYFAMECFRSVDQQQVDLYLDGKLEIEELFTQTRFDKYWGFPRQNYQMLIEFCRHHGIKITGINTENAGRDSIKKRDDHCAKILSTIVQQDPNSKILLLIGEYHLADDKLPGSISEKHFIDKKSVVKIITNTDRYFESVEGAFSSFESVHLKLNKNFYSILNTSPWLKWMSALHWEETRQNLNQSDYIEEDSDEDYNIFDFDFDHFFLHIAKQTASLLNIELGDSLLSHFTIVNLSDVRDFQSFARDNSYSPKSARQLRLFSEIFGAFVSEDSRIIFLKNYSFSSLASAVGQFLTMASMNGNQQKDAKQRELSLLIGQISSKLLNPKVKLKTIKEIGPRRFRSFMKIFMHQRQTEITRATDAVALAEAIDGLADLFLHHATRTKTGEKLLLEFFQSLDKPSLALSKIVRFALDYGRPSRSTSATGTKKAS
jgi:hypothetical protein